MKGEILWFAKPGTVDVLRFIRDLDARGLVYRQPDSNKVGIQVLERDAVHREMPLEDVADYFDDEPDWPTAILWLDRSTDVLFGPHESRDRWWFSLDGLDWSQAQRVVFAVVACALGTPGTLGVVVDRNLPEGYEDWIRCFDHGTAIPYEPDLLLLASTAGNHNHALIVPPSSWITRPPTSPSPPTPDRG